MNQAKQAPEAAALHIPSLDGLRAVSFLIVFLSHAGLEMFPGGFGVTVFFFLSGYLITTLMRREMEQTGTVSFKLFYLRRALRILPPFYLVLTTVTALTALGIIHGELAAAPVLSQFLHYCNYWFALNDWRGIAPGTGVYWSLAIEEHFYALFPMLYLFLYRRQVRERSMAFTFWALCALILVWRCILIFGLHVDFSRVFTASETRFDAMLFGCALAVWKNPMLDETERPPSPALRVVAFPAALLVLVLTLLPRSTEFRETIRYTIQSVALYPVFITAMRYPEWGVFRVLNWPLVRKMGALSYALYLVHHSVIDVFWQRFPKANLLIGIVVPLLISLALAQAIFHFVEKPCAKLRRRLK